MTWEVGGAGTSSKFPLTPCSHLYPLGKFVVLFNFSGLIESDKESDKGSGPLFQKKCSHTYTYMYNFTHNFNGFTTPEFTDLLGDLWAPG